MPLAVNCIDRGDSAEGGVEWDQIIVFRVCVCTSLAEEVVLVGQEAPNLPHQGQAHRFKKLVLAEGAKLTFVLRGCSFG